MSAEAPGRRVEGNGSGSDGPAERIERGGGCGCGRVRYRLLDEPLIVHACHCRHCQRETGSAFALNALIETDRLEILRGEPERIQTPSASGIGQGIERCPACRVALFSVYGGVEAVRFVRVGTLDDPDSAPPDVHIYTATRLPWLALPEGVPSFPEYYDPETVWPERSLERRRRYRATG